MPTPLLPMLQDAMKAGASDILIVSGSPLAFKINGRITHVGTEHLSPGDTEELIRAIYELDRQRSLDALLNSGDDDFSFSVSGLGRFRCSAYKQRSSLSAVLRIVSFSERIPLGTARREWWKRWRGFPSLRKEKENFCMKMARDCWDCCKKWRQ